MRSCSTKYGSIILSSRRAIRDNRYRFKKTRCIQVSGCVDYGQLLSCCRKARCPVHRASCCRSGYRYRSKPVCCIDRIEHAVYSEAWHTVHIIRRCSWCKCPGAAPICVRATPVDSSSSLEQRLETTQDLLSSTRLYRSLCRYYQNIFMKAGPTEEELA